MELKGYVGKGKGYDSNKREWHEGLEQLLGYSPFKGTLNVAIVPNLTVDEFSDGTSVITPFKDFVCLEGEIEGVRAHMCYSLGRKSEKINTFYVISSVKLRDKLKLEDRDKVKIKIKEVINDEG